MSLAEIWGQVLVVFISWPPLTAAEVTIVLFFVSPRVRRARELLSKIARKLG